MGAYLPWITVAIAIATLIFIALDYMEKRKANKNSCQCNGHKTTATQNGGAIANGAGGPRVPGPVDLSNSIESTDLQMAYL